MQHPKPQQQQPAMEGTTHLMWRNGTSRSLKRHHNTPQKEVGTWLSKSTSCVGISAGTAKPFSLILPYSFSSKS